MIPAAEARVGYPILMRKFLLTLAALGYAPTVAAAQTAEQWRAAGNVGFSAALIPSFLAAPAAVPPAAVGPSPEKRTSRVERLEPKRRTAPFTPGTTLARVDLASSLDSLRRSGPVTLGGQNWTVGLAADAEFKHFFLTLTGAGTTDFNAIARPKDLLGAGVTLKAGATSYRCTLSLCLISPLRDSTLELTPAAGGRTLSWTTGGLLDLLEKQAASFKLDDDTYYLAYLSDLDPATAAPTGTRSLLFFKERRFLPEAWRLPEAELPAGETVAVEIDGTTVVLFRGVDDVLTLYTP